MLLLLLGALAMVPGGPPAASTPGVAGLPPGPLAQALSAARGSSDLRLEVEAVQTRPADCTPRKARAQRPIEVSGDHVLELQGRDSAGARCRGWARISLRAFAPVLVTTQAVRGGDPLDGAARLEERELLPGRDRLVSLAPGATAARTLSAGTELAPRLVRDPGPRPGDPVQVVFRGRGLAIERPGRVVACGGDLACAIVASGKKVVGRRVGDRIEVDAR